MSTERPYASHPRTMNLTLAFDVSGIRGARFNASVDLGVNASTITRITNGEQLANQKQMAKIATTLGLVRVPGFTIEMFDAAPAAFSSHLMRHGFGTYARIDGVMDWLNGIEQTGGFFLEERVLKRMLGSYRGFGQPGAVVDDVADAVGDIGKRYGVVISVPEGPVLQAVRRQSVVALILHRQRDSGRIDVLRTEPRAGHGHVGIVSFLAGPPPDPEFEILGEAPAAAARFENCLLADVERDGDGLPRPGYLIGGPAGRRDIHVFLFEAAAFTQELADIVGKTFDGAVGLRLRDAAAHGQATGQALVARVVYDAQ